METTTKALTVWKHKPKPEYAEGVIGSLAASMVITVLMFVHLKPPELAQTFLISFIILNAIFAVLLCRNGWMRPVTWLAPVIFFGPIIFYFWTIYFAHVKYWQMRKDGPLWTLARLRNKIRHGFLDTGFDFEMPLKSCGKTAAYIMEKGWSYDIVVSDCPDAYSERKGHWICIAVAKNEKVLAEHEAGR